MAPSSLKSTIKGLMPPLVTAAYQRLQRNVIRYRGPYPDWESARREAGGYATEQILERVRAAAIKVRNGEAAFERDSLPVSEIAFPFPLLSALLRVAVRDGSRLEVMDFGGSLGSSYYQCLPFLKMLARLRWTVVEQENFVACGNREFATEELRFAHSIGECLREGRPSVALLSSVLPYVSDPYDVLAELSRAAIRDIVIDRTHCHSGTQDLIFVQHVPASIYPASYPCRIFSRARLEAALQEQYELIAGFDAIDGPVRAGGTEVTFRGWIWTRKPGP